MNALCFYSKYSNQCKTFVDQTKSLNLQFICIDNSIARKKIQNSKKLEIQYVPCVLILYDNGVVEKYEGEHAFRWAQTQPQPQTQIQPQPQTQIQPQTQTQTQPQPQPQPQPQTQTQPQPQPQPQTPSDKKDKLVKKKTDIANLKEEKPEKLSVKDLAQQLQSERNAPLIPK